MANILDSSVKYVTGVGEARARVLEKELGILTVGDLLRHYPYRYIDRTRIYRIAEVDERMASSLVQLRARVTGVGYAGAGRKQRFSVYVSDDSGSAELIWFRGIKWMEKSVEVGREYIVFGRPMFYRGELSMAHPELELVEKAFSRPVRSGMQGIYPSSEKMASTFGTRGFYNIVCNAWILAQEHIGETMPEPVRLSYGLMPLREAMFNIHFPQSAESLARAERRLKFDEFLGVQLSVQSHRTDRMTRRNGFLFPRVGAL